MIPAKLVPSSERATQDLARRPRPATLDTEPANSARHGLLCVIRTVA
jgi:hypothetical protein